MTRRDIFSENRLMVRVLLLAAGALVPGAGFAAAGHGDADVKPTLTSEFSAGQQFNEVLRSGGVTPEMVVIPSGQFLMGSPASEEGRYPDESPQHAVRIDKPFALGRTEVTVAQFRAFVDATGYVTTAENGEGSMLRDPASGHWRMREGLSWRHDQSGNPAQAELPVVHVSYDDAQAYITWLAKETGKSYRLPTEAELEYANRAGTTTAFWWGDSAPTDKVGNLRGEGDMVLMAAMIRKPTRDEVEYIQKEGFTPETFYGYNDGFGGLAPVASFKANPFGLHDTTGNVWEWTQDCYQDDYVDAPTDGSARTTATCGQRVLRGGSWYCFPRHARSANRWSERPFFRNMYVGFRVARDI